MLPLNYINYNEYGKHGHISILMIGLRSRIVCWIAFLLEMDGCIRETFRRIWVFLACASRRDVECGQI